MKKLKSILVIGKLLPACLVNLFAKCSSKNINVNLMLIYCNGIFVTDHATLGASN